MAIFNSYKLPRLYEKPGLKGLDVPVIASDIDCNVGLLCEDYPVLDTKALCTLLHRAETD